MKSVIIHEIEHASCGIFHWPWISPLIGTCDDNSVVWVHIWPHVGLLMTGNVFSHAGYRLGNCIILFAVKKRKKECQSHWTDIYIAPISRYILTIDSGPIIEIQSYLTLFGD